MSDECSGMIWGIWHDACKEISCFIETFTGDEATYKFHKDLAVLTTNWDGRDLIRANEEF